MIDSEGYRANVGIILSNDEGKVFWARRCGQNAWQFPQGGITSSETPEQAMFGSALAINGDALPKTDVF